MKFPVSLYVIAILAGPIYSVLGGFVEQLEELEGAFYNDAEAGLDDLGATDASRILTDFQTLITDAEGIVNEVQGHSAVSADDQQTVFDTLNKLTPAIQSLFEMTGQEAGDFVDSDRKTVQDAANAFSEVNGAMLEDLKSIVPNHAAAFDLMKAKDDKADADVNNDDNVKSILRRRKASRNFRA